MRVSTPLVTPASGHAGGVRFSLRSTVAGLADYCRGPTDLRLVAAAQFGRRACLCSVKSCDGPQLWQLQRHTEQYAQSTRRRTSYDRQSDYDVFELLLSGIQTAYSAEDLSALRAMITPEMLSYFSEELAANVSRGLINRVTDVKLLQGDLAEAWREGRNEYATVAMKFALRDSMIERASGRIVEGGQESVVTELWTFVRASGGNWLLSAIQQT